MKHINKHTISIILITCSIFLLVVFQYFWLKKLYEEQRIFLQKEVDNIFRTTIINLQDALFQQNISHAFIEKKDALTKNIITSSNNISADTFIYFSDKETRITLRNGAPLATKTSHDSVTASMSLAFRMQDSAHALPTSRRNRVLEFASRLPISPDNIRSIQLNKILQKVVMNVQDTDVREIIIRIDNDTLVLDSVKNEFADTLRAAKIPIQFHLKKIAFPGWKTMPTSEQLSVGPIPAGPPPQGSFVAELYNYERYLFQKIVPQLLFSVFLTAITFFSFWLIYRSLRQQQKLAIIKNDFISNITHELKTPIATVSVAIEALRNFNAIQNPQLTKEYLDISKNELNRLTILVDKVLKMAIFEHSAPELRFETFNFSEMVQQIVDSMKLQFEKYHARVDIEQLGADFTISGDRIHLTSVVYNLIDNALKYSKEHPEIYICLEGQNGQLHLAIRDKGIGIPAEYKNRIFEKFFRVPTGDVHNVKGYGLGLNYVSSVVKQHGGSIEVESEAGEGSTFTVQLPRENQH